jgi:hypothetical protein
MPNGEKNSKKENSGFHQLKLLTVNIERLMKSVFLNSDSKQQYIQFSFKHVPVTATMTHVIHQDFHSLIQDIGTISGGVYYLGKECLKQKDNTAIASLLQSIPWRFSGAEESRGGEGSAIFS